MFEVIRWPGPVAAAAVKPKKGGGALSLQELHTRARQRVEARRNQAVSDEKKLLTATGERVMPSSGANGAIHIPSAGETTPAGNEAGKDDRRASRKEKKRRKREEADEVRDKVEEVKVKEETNIAIHMSAADEIDVARRDDRPLSKNEKKKKREGIDEVSHIVEDVILKFEPSVSHLEPTVKKKSKPQRAPSAAEQDMAEEMVYSSGGGELNEMNVDNGEITPMEKSRKNKRRPGGAICIVRTGDTTKMKRRKKEKAVDEEAESQDDKTDVVDHSMVDNTGELPSEQGAELPPGQAVDLFQIAKDVALIVGKPPATAAMEMQGKRPPILPWMREPLEFGGLQAQPLNQVPFLDARLEDALRKSGFVSLFPVQVSVWNQTVGPGNCEHDLCVCSPTGSGKTLSYALPIVQKLSTRILRRLRALVVLPTRDLATQVKAVFDIIAPSVGLKVGLAVGQTSIKAEAAQLLEFKPKAANCFVNQEAPGDDFAGSSVDVLVATPGRLMDHLHNTKWFTLQHLLYLVVDETDRLLRQSYQDWLSNVLKTVAATESRKRLSTSACPVSSGASFRSVQTIRYLGHERGLRSTVFPRLMKIVLSATLTRDPSKIAQLALHSPMYIAKSAEDNRYQLPQQLQAFKLVCTAGEKPLYLAALLQELAAQQTIVFTASVVATHRLFTLLSLFEGLPINVVEYSSLQHQQARSYSLAKFRDGEAQVLIASDAMTRGMDVEGVGNVVNYDMPVYAKTYVHRVGRTARAGRAGCSYTILRKEEVRHFKSLLKKADNSSCKDYRLRASATEELYDRYVRALENLKEGTLEESAGAPAPAGKTKTKPGHGVTTEHSKSGPDELFL